MIKWARITPAGAGKTMIIPLSLSADRGSPPQVRGKQIHIPRALVCFGITPAGAGKTACSVPSSASSRDHPRRCGENSLKRHSRDILPGSPPQVRGKQCATIYSFAPRGITPAGAGKTAFERLLENHTEDHPRRCGENPKYFSGCRTSSGSPPQVRGKLISTVLQGITQRITPAGAGKTTRHRRSRRRSRDHPRRCGENRMSRECRLSDVGSPPQVRGKLTAKEGK